MKFLNKKATRDAYGETLLELGATDKRIVVLDADLSSSTKTSLFAKTFPDRFFNVGVAEQNLMGISAGLASCGKIPFASSFAVFATGRAWDQIRQSICYSGFNVKIVATHGGITVGEDGATHQANEDIALMRTLPSMVVIVPADAEETKSAIKKVIDYIGPVYIRLSRLSSPVIFEKGCEFEIGKAKIVKEGTDITIVSCGIMLSIAIEGAELLKNMGVDAEVINMSTVKPIDAETLLKSVKKTKKVITIEEHSIIGGLGSAVAEVLSSEFPVPIKMLGIKDHFGISGKAEELLVYFKLTPENIVEKYRELKIACEKE